MTDQSRSKAAGRTGRMYAWLMLAAAMVVGLAAGPAAGQIRIVNYNIAQLNGDNNALEDVLAEMHEDATRGFEIPVTIFVFQEVDEDEFNQLTNIVQGAAPAGVTYLPATFTSFNESNSGGAQACYYNSSVVTEVPAEHDDIATGANRASDRWYFTLDNYSSPDAAFYIYSSHLKAGDSGSDADDRVDGVNALQLNAQSLPAGSHFIMAGDFNFYSNTEPAYLDLLAPGPVRVYDQLGAGSWAGSGNAFKHTQSPRLPSIGPLIGGGMDDRFDFQFVNIEFNDGEGLARIIGDYRAFGNDANHYNDSINSGNNTYFSTDIPRSNALADDLYAASDHLPVMCDYQLPAMMLAFMPAPNVGRVIQGAPVNVVVNVQNIANVVDQSGGDELDYVVTGSGGLSGSANGSVPALSTPAVELLAVDTSTVGPVSGTMLTTTTSEGAEIVVDTGVASGTVLRPAVASFSDAADLDAIEVTANYDADTGVQSFDVPVYNFGFDSDQAMLDVDSIDPVSLPFTFTGGLATDIGSTPAMLGFTFDTTALTPGTYMEVLDVTTSDEDIPGESTTVLALTLTITIDGVDTCLADIADSDGPNPDGMVNLFDLLLLLDNWGTSGVGADISAEGGGAAVVDLFDLLDMLDAWGMCAK